MEGVYRGEGVRSSPGWLEGHLDVRFGWNADVSCSRCRTLIDLEASHSRRSRRVTKFGIVVARLRAQPFNELGSSSGLKREKPDWVVAILLEQEDGIVAPRAAIIGRHFNGAKVLDRKLTRRSLPIAGPDDAAQDLHRPRAGASPTRPDAAQPTKHLRTLSCQWKRGQSPLSPNAKGSGTPGQARGDAACW